MFEKNKPASFKQPLYSFISDWRMLSDVATGRLSLIDRKHDKIQVNFYFYFNIPIGTDKPISIGTYDDL